MNAKKQGSVFDWLKLINGWQKSLFVSVITAFTIWLCLYVKDNLSMPANTKETNVVKNELKLKSEKDSLFSIKTETQLTALILKTSLADQKLTTMSEELQSQKNILMNVLFEVRNFNKSNNASKTYSIK